MARPHWQEFDPPVFEQATAQRKLILLLITAPWCSHCKELLETTFADSAVLDRLEKDFIAVRVDAERRPDVNDRYGTGGWPTIAYLTPEGDLIGQDRYLTPRQLATQLDKVVDIYGEHGDEIHAKLQEMWERENAAADRAEPLFHLDQQIVEDVVDAIYEKFDHRYGGWGEKSKFPHPEAIDFALVMIAKRQDQRMKEVVTLTLDKMMEGAIHDTIDGGFFRFSRTPDWRQPNFEKVLDANAQRLRCYLEAYQLLGDNGYRKTAEGIVAWIMDFMVDPENEAFCGSQDADADYYVLDAEGRMKRGRPKIDRTIYANWNAMTISSLLKASAVLERPDLRDQATRSLNFLLENLYDGAGTVYHYWDGTYHLPGLLTDQAYMMRALIDASQHTGNADLLLPAEAIAEKASARQRAPDGGYYDILQDNTTQGSMRRRNRSILENAVMAEALVRLSYLSRRPEFYDEAIRTLEAFTDGYKEYGYYVAGYGRAIDLVFYPPLTVTIVADRESEQADALRRAALRTYVPSRMVQMLDPKYDPILLQRGGFDTKGPTRAYVSVGKTTKAVVTNPDELLQQMELVETERREGL
ncbi:MAG: thioredoxin domain-containing protein [Planctomycetota bacterium]|jgi:uncharacterized protein YyaL (SSP411 family)